jgi:hypothetical protein
MQSKRATEEVILKDSYDTKLLNSCGKKIGGGINIILYAD